MLRAPPTSSFLFDHPQLLRGGYSSCTFQQLRLPVPPALLGLYICHTHMLVKEPKCFFFSRDERQNHQVVGFHSRLLNQAGWVQTRGHPLIRPHTEQSSVRNYTLFLRTVSYWRGVDKIYFLQTLHQPQSQEQTPSILMEIQAHRCVPYVLSADS